MTLPALLANVLMQRQCNKKLHDLQQSEWASVGAHVCNPVYVLLTIFPAASAMITAALARMVITAATSKP